MYILRFLVIKAVFLNYINNIKKGTIHARTINVNKNVAFDEL